jgi:hypothetical protein
VDPDRALRLTGAILLLIGGALHLQLHLDDYGTRTIGRGFLLNAAASALVAAYLVLRTDRLGLLAGIGLSLATLATFILTRTGDGFLNFHDTGLNPAPQALLTVLTELGATAVLATALLRPRNPTTTTTR